MQRKIDSILDASVANRRLRGVTALVCNNNGILYEGGAGLANGHAMTTDTVCAIYSMTKPVTAAAAMQPLKARFWHARTADCRPASCHSMPIIMIHSNHDRSTLLSLVDNESKSFFLLCHVCSSASWSASSG